MSRGEREQALGGRRRTTEGKCHRICFIKSDEYKSGEFKVRSNPSPKNTEPAQAGRTLSLGGSFPVVYLGDVSRLLARKESRGHVFTPWRS